MREAAVGGHDRRRGADLVAHLRQRVLGDIGTLLGVIQLCLQLLVFAQVRGGNFFLQIQEPLSAS